MGGMTASGNKWGAMLAALCTVAVLEVLYFFGAPFMRQSVVRLGISGHWVSILYGSGAVLLLAIAAALILRLARWRNALGLTTPSAAQWRTATAMFGLLFPIALIGRLLVPDIDAQYIQLFGLSSAGALGWFALTLPLFLLSEEIILRTGQLIIARPFGRLVGIIVMAANFSLLHFPFAFPQFAASVVVSTLFGAFVLGSLYARSGNFWLTFLAHLLFDVLMVFQIVFHVWNLTAAEVVLWLVFGLLFLIGVRRAVTELRAAGVHHKPLTMETVVTFLVVGVLLPFFFLFLLR